MAVSHDLGIKNAMNFEATEEGTMCMSMKLSSSRARWFEKVSECMESATDDFFKD